MSDEKKELKGIFKDYFLKTHIDDIREILNVEDSSGNFKVCVDCMDLLLNVCTLVGEIGFMFFIDTLPYLEVLQLGLLDAQKFIFETENENGSMIYKEKLFARLHNLPQQEGVQINIPKVENIDKMVCFNGTVMKASLARMLESSQEYECKKCGYVFSMEIDYNNESLMAKPNKCPKGDCNSDKFKQINSEENFKLQVKDYQEIKIQEKLESLTNGALPKSCTIVLEDDLVDICKPGDNVTVNGIVVDRWKRLTVGLRPELELVIKANNVEVHNQNDIRTNVTKVEEKIFRDFWNEYKNRPFTGRNIILDSLCPQLYGMYIVKLAVSLVLCGGVSRQDSTGIRVRGESHLLLVGDPGTGKSQFLKYANKLMPRSVLTTGIGSTSAGLTATASRDGGLWHLEAGALVLADGGICCVDEFNCMKEQDRASMLEAMEQQSISVAKAGIVCKLKTRCTVLAACNPKGTYDSNQPLTVNIAISSPLLSRFDLVLLLMDSANEDWDRLASTFLLEGKDLLVKERIKPWKFEQLRLYINYVKKFTPLLTPEANQVIQKYYQLQRQADDRNAARTTVRMLESIIRLSQAHAKLMFRKEVTVMDAVVAITLMECSLNKSASFGNVNILHTSFPDNAEMEYRNQAELILKKLNLNGLLNDEFAYMEANYDLKPPAKQPSPNKVNPIEVDEITPSQNFDVISQLVGDISTQKYSGYNNKSNTTSPELKLSNQINSVKSPENKDKVLYEKVDQLKKRTIDEIQSPSMTNINNQNESNKKAKLSSQTLRKLNRFAFEEKTDNTKNIQNNTNDGMEVVEISDIPQTDDLTKQAFVAPVSENYQSTQIIDNTQSMSKSQKIKSSMQYSQKTLLSLNDDDLNIDF